MTTIWPRRDQSCIVWAAGEVNTAGLVWMDAGVGILWGL